MMLATALEACGCRPAAGQVAGDREGAEVRAVICAAGFGTRFFPITKVLSKAMLPVLNRPVVDYIVDDCVAGGASMIAVVCREGDRQVEEYLTESPALAENFAMRGWQSKYAEVAEVHRRASFRVLYQPADGPYGSAVPAAIAEAFIGPAQAYLVQGDDFVLRGGSDSLLADLRRLKTASGAAGVIAATPVSPEYASRYGILAMSRRADVWWLDSLVEKPAPGSAPSNMANIGRFLVDGEFFRELRDLAPDPVTGEYVAAHAISEFASRHPVAVYVLAEGYHDCGDVDAWLSANLAVHRHLRANSEVGGMSDREPK